MRVFLLLLITSILLQSASAQTIVGVSPADVLFKNVLRGGYAERYITVSTDSTTPTFISFEAGGDIKDWIHFSVENVTITRTALGRTLISLEPGRDTPNGNYTGFVRVSRVVSTGGPTYEGRATGAITAVMDVVIHVEIVDNEFISCTGRNFEISSVEQNDDVVLKANIENQGNIRLRPRYSVDLWDQDQLVLLKNLEFIGEEILPTRQQDQTFRFSSRDIETGQYWAKVSVPDCYSSDTLTFDIYDIGSLKANGILLSIVAPPQAMLGDTLPLYANFRNTGEKEVDAQFRGSITFNGEIVDVLESEHLQVDRGELSNFTFFFTPRKAGTYIATGRVFYDKKRTFESSAVFTVLDSSTPWKKIFMWIGYALLFAIILYLFYRINLERRKQMLFLRSRHHG